MVSTGMPSSRYLPEVGRSRQPRRFSKVDFPEPDSPMIATNVPRSTVMVTPCKACTTTSPNRYVFLRFRTSMSADTYAFLRNSQSRHAARRTGSGWRSSTGGCWCNRAGAKPDYNLFSGLQITCDGGGLAIGDPKRHL